MVSVRREVDAGIWPDGVTGTHSNLRRQRSLQSGGILWFSLTAMELGILAASPSGVCLLVISCGPRCVARGGLCW
jgi:hypothetical protein